MMSDYRSFVVAVIAVLALSCSGVQSFVAPQNSLRLAGGVRRPIASKAQQQPHQQQRTSSSGNEGALMMAEASECSCAWCCGTHELV